MTKQSTTIKVTYDVVIGPHKLSLDQEEVEALYTALGEVLKKRPQNNLRDLLKDYYKDPKPYPCNPTPRQPLIPINPTYPPNREPTEPYIRPYEIWCGLSAFPK